ncbi:MAG: YdcF family protein [Microcystaceae cyanobacterium]
MGVFFSKILPALFLYPLGWLTLLLSGSLYFAWKQRSWLQIPLSLALAILFISGNFWVSNALLIQLERQNLPQLPLPSADAIVILGGGVYSPTPPRPMTEVNEAGDRVLYGAKLYREGQAPWVITSGGRISWLSGGSPEAQDMAELLTFLGVPPDNILQDPLSLNTEQNAKNVQKIVQEKGLKKLLLVTSAFHMTRAQLIFTKLGMDVLPAPTDFRGLEPAANFNVATVLLNLIPNSEALALITLIIKEYVGIFVVQLFGV